jgi:hypothetical protein
MRHDCSPLADRFSMAAPTFGAGGAPLYAYLAREAARAVEADDEFRAALTPFVGEPDRALLPHRLFAAVHRRVLLGQEPKLVPYYASVEGVLAPDGHAWDAFRDAVVARAAELPAELEGVNQHNEVGRAAPLSVGFLELATRCDLPQRILEVGASAGLLLNWDRYLPLPWYRRMFEDALEAPEHVTPPRIVERRGCDLDPVDPTTAEGGLRLRSFVWADLADHMRMLDDAIGIGERHPVTVDQANGTEWLEVQLGAAAPGVLTVVFQSLVPAGPEQLDSMAEIIYEAGERATQEAPLAYLALQVPGTVPGRPVQCQPTLTTFPDDEFRTLVTCDINGRHVRRFEE